MCNPQCRLTIACSRVREADFSWFLSVFGAHWLTRAFGCNREGGGNGLMQRLGRVFGCNRKAATASSESATLQMLRRALGGECRGCDHDLSQHSIVLIGLTIATSETTQRVIE